MTINNPAAFCAGFWDWGILNGCFGETKIKPTDWDGVVERKGQFLVFETKAAGADIPQGQLIMFQQLVKTMAFNVIVVWGPTSQPEAYQIISPRKTGPKTDCDLPSFRQLVERWFKWADDGGYNKKQNGNGTH